MRIRRTSRAAGMAMMMAAASAPAQTRTETRPICAESAAEAFERLGPPARHWSDEDGAVRYRDYPSARFGHWARHGVRAEVDDYRVDVSIRDTGGFDMLRQQLLREYPRIACTTRTVAWAPEPEQDPYAYPPDFPVGDAPQWEPPAGGGDSENDENGRDGEDGEDAGEVQDFPAPAPEVPHDVALTDCEWNAPEGQREGLIRLEVREHYGDLIYQFGRAEVGRWLEVTCAHRGPLPYGWQYRWRDDWWN